MFRSVVWSLVLLLVYESASRSVSQLVSQFVDQLVGQSVYWSAGWSIGQTFGPSVGRSLGWSVGRSGGVSVGLSVGRSDAWLVSHFQVVAITCPQTLHLFFFSKVLDSPYSSNLDMDSNVDALAYGSVQATLRLQVTMSVGISSRR